MDYETYISISEYLGRSLNVLDVVMGIRNQSNLHSSLSLEIT
jgi:hypothetical protein